MNIKINIGLEEYLDFQRMQFQINKQVKKVVKRTRFMLPFFVCLFFIFETCKEGIHVWIPFLPFVLLLLLWIWLIPKHLLWSSVRRSKKIFLDPANAHMFGEMEIDFCEDDIKLKAHNNESIIKWQNLIGFKESAQNIFIFITTLQAIIIPKNQITLEELNELKELLQSKINQTI